MMNRSFSVAAAMATLLALASLGVAGTGSAADANAAQVIADQSTTDHEALAKRFDDEAAQFEKEAAEHEHLAKNYRSGIGVGPKGNATSLASHCDRIAKSLKASAADAREMARMHREMAQAAAK